MTRFIQDMERSAAFLDDSRGVVPWIFLFFIIASCLQFAIPFPVDCDTAYHFAVGKLTAEHGILKSFPWTPFSLQADHYGDKEFLFHMLFVPMAGMELIRASRIVGVLCEGAILTALFLLLRAEQVRLAGLWALLPVCSSAFVFRFAQVRPHLISIVLALLLIWAFSRNRLRILAVVSVLYPLFYVAFWQIPLLLMLASAAALRLAGGRLSLKPVATVFGGIAAGVVLHPNTVNLLSLNWIHMVDILFRNAWGDRPGFQLGAEFTPYPVSQWLPYLALSAAMALCAGILSWRARHADHFPLAFAIAALLFWMLTMRSARFAEYSFPFTAAALALSARPLRWQIIAPLALGVSISCTVLFGLEPYKNLMSLETKKSFIDPVVVKTLQETIPEGAQIFTSSWDYTGSLMLALPGRKFIVAQDPTLMYKKDPKVYELWYQTIFSPGPDAAEVIRTRFGSRYVVCLREPDMEPFFTTLFGDPTVATYASDRWLLFDLYGTVVRVLR